MFGTIWVTGASSGIGAAFVDLVPHSGSRVIGISRRPHPSTEHLAADLGDQSSWGAVEASFDEGLAARGEEGALFFHCAGTAEPSGPMVDADPGEYARSVILNAASGQVLGRAFLAAAVRSKSPATLVICSSPAAHKSLAGMTHYCGGKAAIEQWARAAAAEFGGGPGAPRIFSVLPYAVDTAMVRGAMERSGEELPLSDYFHELDSRGAFATPIEAATEIWQAIDRGAGGGEAVAVGAIPAEQNSA